MRRRRAGAAVLGAVGIVLGTCYPTASPATDQSRDLVTSDIFQSLIADSRDMGPVASSTPIDLVLELQDPHVAQRLADLEAIYRTGSPTYGHFSRPEALVARYGPSPEAVSKVQRELQSAGLRAIWEPGATWVAVRGPAHAVEDTFQVKIHNYESPAGIKYFASDRDPSVPPRLAPLVIRAGHLSNYPWERVQAIPDAGLTPPDISLAYDIKPLRDQNIDGTDQTVVIWALGDGYNSDDLNSWSDHFGLPRMKIVPKGGPEDAPVKVELMMDLEVIHAIAPGATLIVYTNPKESHNDVISTLQTMVAQNPRAIFSLSFGGCESSTADAPYAKIFDDAAMAGDAVFASSGDSGAYQCMERGNTPPPTRADIGVSCPACFASVTAVGGTRLSVRADGSWYNEVVWEMPAEVEGTGGGISSLVDRPAYQKHDFMRNTTDKRQIPDVSADGISGMAIFYNKGWHRGGGTSQSAPIWAGIAALTNQYLERHGHKPLGLLNTALYAVAENQAYPAFHDVTVGDNLEYPAGPGYDLATGLGTPDVWNLVRDLEAYQRKAGA